MSTALIILAWATAVILFAIFICKKFKNDKKYYPVVLEPFKNNLIYTDPGDHTGVQLDISILIKRDSKYKMNKYYIQIKLTDHVLDGVYLITTLEEDQFLEMCETLKLQLENE